MCLLELLSQDSVDTGGKNNKHLFFTLLEAEKLKIKVLMDSFSGEKSPSGLQVITF